jgi:hypothetical protein
MGIVGIIAMRNFVHLNRATQFPENTGLAKQVHSYVVIWRYNRNILGDGVSL